ncbi:lysozyme [Paraburkholderia humisilvae]|uniref:Lysozyme n=1 Tax=Paraburkholderia humisilvae TaxID=627669 RepID=A0A6J5DH75_9BURK|nr:lysozyme [Paraburkholderia humisilvae]CAB3752522.1 hypothetical protein LMG29542_01791 [Paraburkholderia humisilvae]
MTDAICSATTNTTPGSNVNVYTSRLCKPWKISDDAVKFLKGWEQYAEKMYDNDGSKSGNATIGYGHLVHSGKITGTTFEKSFEKGISQAEAEKLLRHDVEIPERIVNDKIKIPLYQFEYDALVCFTYNLQRHAVSLLDFVNKGDYSKVGDRMREYSHSGKQLVMGLKRRRHREAEMFEAGVYDSSH